MRKQIPFRVFKCAYLAVMNLPRAYIPFHAYLAFFVFIYFNDDFRFFFDVFCAFF
jgi:hypothetical protein